MPALGFLFTLFECLGTIIISGSGPAISGSNSSLRLASSGRGCRGHRRSFVVVSRCRTAIFRVVVFTEFRGIIGGLFPVAGNGNSYTYLLLIMLEQSWCWRRAWLVSGCLTFMFIIGGYKKLTSRYCCW